MAYPNSGTAYGQNAIQDSTQTTVATFYGHEFALHDNVHQSESILVFEHLQEGPFLY